VRKETSSGFFDSTELRLSACPEPVLANHPFSNAISRSKERLSFRSSGEAFVTNLDEPLWEKRGVSRGAASGEALWMVEFYAPWCSHCMRSVPQVTKTVF
jgi:hypothetical protein